MQRVKAIQDFNSTVGAFAIGDVVEVDDATAALFITAGLAEEVAVETRTADASSVKKKAVKWEPSQD